MSNDKHHRHPPKLLAAARELRRPQTPAERKLWSRLRDRQLAGYKFRRQQPIHKYIADFYCAETKLVIELDGESHVNQIEYDAERTKYLTEEGYTVVRFTNREVMNQFEVVLRAIADECERLINDNPPSP